MAAPTTSAARKAPAQLRANRMSYARGITIPQSAQRTLNVPQFTAPNPSTNRNQMDASYDLQRARLTKRMIQTPSQNLQQAALISQTQTSQSPTTESREEDDPTNDPVYKLRAATQEAQQDVKDAALQAVNTAADQIGASAASEWLVWQWTSIPAILTGAGILDFLAAMLASYVSLIRTFVEKNTEGETKKAILGISMSVLPPAFEFMPSLAPVKSKNLMGMAAGFMEFVFFITSHFVLLLLIVLAVIGSIIAALPFILPFIGAGALALYFQTL